MAYTTINDPTQYFNTVLYTGTGSSTSITGVGFQPDLVYTTSRSNGYNNGMFDSSRGVQKEITTNTTNAEATLTTAISSFDSDGFSFSGSAYNTSAYTFVAWNWLANGGTTSSNTDGTKTTTVQASTTSGFSIVTYNGLTNGQTIGHGLGGTPEMIIFKSRNVVTSWHTWHQGLGDGNNYLLLNTTGAKNNDSYEYISNIGSSTVQLQGSSSFNQDTVGYFFRGIKGYSKFGSYKGNGSSDGTFVYTGFKPSWIMTKGATTAQAWSIRDNTRDSFNSAQKSIYANLTDAESVNVNNSIDLLSNGFKIRNQFGTENQSGETFIYMAFAESPFVSSDGVPTTAR